MSDRKYMVGDLVISDCGKGYEDVKKSTLEEARSKAYSSINFYMVEAYWNIGKLIVESTKWRRKS